MNKESPINKFNLQSLFPLAVGAGAKVPAPRPMGWPCCSALIGWPLLRKILNLAVNYGTVGLYPLSPTCLKFLSMLKIRFRKNSQWCTG